MKVVYLHGFASGPDSGKAKFFSGRFAEQGILMAVPDLAEGDFEHLTITSQLGVVERFVGGEAVTLIGSSLGGYLAALYASLDKEVSKLVLLAPAFGFAQRWPDLLGAEAMEEWRRSGKRRVFHYGCGCEKEIGYGLVADGLEYPAQPEFGQPALIFHGSEDDVVPVALSQDYATGRSNVRLRVLRSDHQLTNSVEAIWADMLPFMMPGP